jgi:hypothetical protein
MAHLLVSAHQSTPAHPAFAAQHRPTWGLSPSSGRPSHRRVACRRWPFSRTRMELNRSAARPASLSRTSSVPVDSPPPFTPRNGQELNPHHYRPPASPVPPRLTLPDPIKKTPTPAANYTTHSHCPHFFNVPPSAALPSSSCHRHPSPPLAQLSHPAAQCLPG